MKSVIKIIVRAIVFLFVSAVTAAIAHRLGASDFNTGALSLLAGRAAYDLAFECA